MAYKSSSRDCRTNTCARNAVIRFIITKQYKKKRYHPPLPNIALTDDIAKVKSRKFVRLMDFLK